MLCREGFELALGGTERISDSDLWILVSSIFLVIAINHNLGTVGEGEVNSNLIPLAVGFVLMGRVERHTASRDPVVELL